MGRYSKIFSTDTCPRCSTHNPTAFWAKPCTVFTFYFSNPWKLEKFTVRPTAQNEDVFVCYGIWRMRHTIILRSFYQIINFQPEHRENPKTTDIFNSTRFFRAIKLWRIIEKNKKKHERNTKAYFIFLKRIFLIEIIISVHRFCQKSDFRSLQKSLLKWKKIEFSFSLIYLCLRY